jgi:hypothetical protein
MAVYIKSDRLGSRPEPTPKRYKGVRTYYNQHIEKRKEELKQEYESNAEVQEWRTKTPEERARNAIDRQTKLVKEYSDATLKTDTTADAANKKCVQIAERAEKEKSGGK